MKYSQSSMFLDVSIFSNEYSQLVSLLEPVGSGSEISELSGSGPGPEILGPDGL